MFVTTDREKYIDIVIKSVLTNLNGTEYQYIFKKYCELLDYIFLKLLIDDEDSDKFYEQLKRNKNREIIAILYLFFPYINDSNNYEKFKLIKNLSDITVKKNNDTYEICNFQYSRGYQEGDTYKEYLFSIDDIEINFEILKNTIENLRTKFYINWVNAIPILVEKYQESKIYKNTVEYYIKNNEEYKDTALPFGEFYDTIVNDLYLNTVDFKWLLFEKSVNGKIIMYLDILNDIFPVYNILNDIEGSKWLLINDNKKTLFTKNMELYFSKVEKGESYNDYPHELLKDFFVYMLNFFDTKYNFISDIDDYNKVKGDNDLEDFEEDLEEDEKIKQQKESEIIKYFKNFKLINNFYLYDFIRAQILKIKKSWYGYKIFRDSKIVKLDEYTNIKTNKYYHPYSLDKIDENASYKNIYNFSKSLYYYNSIRKKEDASFQKYLDLSIPLNFNGFSIEKKNNLYKILEFINDISKQEYKNSNLKKSTTDTILLKFNIQNNLKKKYSEFNYDNEKISNMNGILILNILNSITDIVFECLCIRGLLSEFIIRRKEFEKSNLNQNKNDILLKANQKLFEDHLAKYENAHYYITDDRYKNLKKITNYKNNKDETYFKFLTDKDNGWFNFYALDWVSQINFYNHYMNQRIVMLTGGTGVGKSTQTPKLLLYGLKAFDKRFKGKVICTQPRIAPTTDNAKRISIELGVPITNYSVLYKKDVKTTNGYIQYKYEKDDHIDDDQEFFLRIVTDGSLLTEIKKSPLLKQIKNDSRTDIDINNNKIFSLKNLYDIVIIDESHEHNPNMDIILTMLRTSIFLNNKLRLYIVSATMDADDPIYRKYYRYINDNLLYPIRDTYNSITDTFNKLLDKNVIDRRIHISPPGETTQYKITEIYNSTELDEKESYELAIKNALDICLNSSSINNDILLFCTTSNKIIKLVDELNAVLPGDTLAIPFYTNLPQDSKDLIQGKLYQIKQLYKFDRKYIHDVLNNKKKAEEVNSNYKYNRILIVSTNIAEASITINTLKFVIDTGFNLDVSYNYETGTSNIEVIKISEASRLQRKGRVGRVGDGTVYYTYPKNGRLNIKPSYNICKVNFSNTFLDLMEENDDGSEIYNKAFYPYKNYFQTNDFEDDPIRELYKRLQLEMEKNKSKKDYKDIKKQLEFFTMLICNQYYTTSTISREGTLSNKDKNLIDSDVYDFLVPFGKSGIDTNYLIDNNLNYYLIHPFENIFGSYRNKNTRLLDNKYISKQKNIKEKIIDDLINRLETNLYVYMYKDHICKVKMVEFLIKLKQKTKDKTLELNLFYPIVAAYKLGIFENVLFIVYFLINNNFDILSIVENLEKFNNIFLNKQSDLLVINNIFTLFKSTYKHILFEDNIKQTIEESFDGFKKNYNNYKNKNLSILDIDDYNNIIYMILKNDHLDKINERLSEKKSAKKIPDYINIEINKWCNVYGINYNAFSYVLSEYNKQYLHFKNVLDNKKNTEYIDKSLIDNDLTIEKNIIRSFLHGNICNIFIYENGHYRNILKFNSNTNYKKNSFKKKWITNVIENRFLLSLNLENDKLNEISKNEDDETDNKTVILNVLSNFDNRMYSSIVYFKDNPTNKFFDKLTNINHNFICNNPVNIEKNKHPLDPLFNEYINLLQSKIKNYIDKNC